MKCLNLNNHDYIIFNAITLVFTFNSYCCLLVNYNLYITAIVNLNTTMIECHIVNQEDFNNNFAYFQEILNYF